MCVQQLSKLNCAAAETCYRQLMMRDDFHQHLMDVVKKALHEDSYDKAGLNKVFEFFNKLLSQYIEHDEMEKKPFLKSILDVIASPDVRLSTRLIQSIFKNRLRHCITYLMKKFPKMLFQKHNNKIMLEFIKVEGDLFGLVAQPVAKSDAFAIDFSIQWLLAQNLEVAKLARHFPNVPLLIEHCGARLNRGNQRHFNRLIAFIVSLVQQFRVDSQDILRSVATSRALVEHFFQQKRMRQWAHNLISIVHVEDIFPEIVFDWLETQLSSPALAAGYVESFWSSTPRYRLREDSPANSIASLLSQWFVMKMILIATGFEDCGLDVSNAIAVYDSGPLSISPT